MSATIVGLIETFRSRRPSSSSYHSRDVHGASKAVSAASAPAALLTAALAVAGCWSYTWYNVVALSPSVIPRRGSPVVTIESSKIRTKLLHKSETFWSPGGESVLWAETVHDSYRDLDVRTCRASLRWSAPSGPEPGGSDVPLAEREMIGPVRFAAGANQTTLVATNTATGQTWVAATGFGHVESVTAVPVARRVVTVSEGWIFVYDLDLNRVTTCPGW